MPLRGGARPSQTDLWVLARTADDLVSIAVEGKVRESFGPTLGEWMAEESAGKTARWSHLCECLGLAPDCDRTLRYQLVHRTATALIEAWRFHARKAALVVHSFSALQDGFGDFQAFASQLGATIPASGQLVEYPEMKPYRLVPSGRGNDPRQHSTADFRIETFRVGDPPKGIAALPVAALPIREGESLLVSRGKRRPALVISTGGTIVPPELRRGGNRWQSTPTILVAPYYGADQGATRGGWPEAFVECA